METQDLRRKNQLRKNSNFSLPCLAKLLIIFFTTICSACINSNPEEEAVKLGVVFAERTFKATHTNEMARLAFFSNMESGASLITTVIANAPDDAKLPPFFMDKAEKKWSVVLRQDDETYEVIIEGFGEDLDKPFITKRVALPSARR